MLRYPIAALALLSVISIATDVAFADYYYVRKSGSDANSGTSASSAFATINQAAMVATNGDKVYVGAGTYTEDIFVLGAKANSDLKFYADIDGTKTGDSGTVLISNATLRVAGSNQIKFEDFTFDGGTVYPVIWQDSYDGELKSCTFLGGHRALLLKDGSLKLYHCTLTDFQEDAVQVDGEANLIVKKSAISGSLRHAISVMKNAITEIDESTITNSGADGLHLEVGSASISVDAVPTEACECTGTSPRDLKQQAYDIMTSLSPADNVYQQILDDGIGKLNTALNSSLWTDDWHVSINSASTVFTNSNEAIEQLHAVYSEDVDFLISNGQVIVNHPFVADVQVIGAEISSGSNHVAVTTEVHAGSKTYGPWGAFNSPSTADVNDNNNPRTFVSPDEFEAAETITVAAQSWTKSSDDSGDEDNDWSSYMTVDTASNSPNVHVLKDGDAMPDISSFNGQDSAATYLQPYIDTDDKISIAENQVIYLFELGTTNLSSSSADFQDLVVLVTMRRPESESLTDDEKDQLRTAIELLVESNRVLADCAIGEANMVNGTSSDLATATQEYQAGVANSSVEQFTGAAIDFQEAWDAAKSSTGYSDPDIAGIVAAQIAPDPPSDWSTISDPEVTIDKSDFNNNEYGVSVLSDHYVDAHDSDFSNNQQWGMYLTGSCYIRKCMLEGNGNGGVLIAGYGNGDLDLDDLDLVDNVGYGVFFDNCQLTLDTSTFYDVSVSGSEHMIGCQGGDLTVDGLSISGGSTTGIYANQASLTLTNATVSNNGYGVAINQTALSVTGSTITDNSVGVYANQSQSFVLSDTSIRDNSSSGIAVVAPAAVVQLDQAEVYDNAVGISCTNLSADRLTLNQTTIRDNTQHGVAFVDSAFTLSSTNTSGSSIRRNANGVYASGSSLSLDQVSVEESSSYDVYCVNSTVQVQGGSLTGLNGIYTTSDNVSLSVDATRFTASMSSSNWAINHNGGGLTMTNCVTSGYQSGIRVNSPSQQVQILSSTLAYCHDEGVQIDAGVVTLRNTIITGDSGLTGVVLAGGTLSHSNNLIYGFNSALAGTSAHDSEVFRNPRFVDAVNDDFRLSVGSPAINAGMDLSANLSADIDGSARPSFGAFEIGAYEYLDDKASFRVLKWQEQE